MHIQKPDALQAEQFIALPLHTVPWWDNSKCHRLVITSWTLRTGVILQAGVDAYEISEETDTAHRGEAWLIFFLSILTVNILFANYKLNFYLDNSSIEGLFSGDSCL